ncbi:MAG TPA: SulP family inorganic anion transporter [Lacipirellulaceae bacterium]|nr:SulP family inorganic anion transporter [Lacipirellulaceae bacterium]
MVGVTVGSHSTLGQAWKLFQGLPRSNLATVALSCSWRAASCSVIALPRDCLFPYSRSWGRSRRAPRSASLSEASRSSVQSLGGLPPIGLPDVTWSEAVELLRVAASCFVMIIAQSAATSRAFAQSYHEHVDEDADILGLSAANAVAAVSGTFVVNGSPTQNAMADRAGARSQGAQLVFAGVVLLVLLFLTGPLQYLPIVFTIALGMIDVKGLRDIRRESPGEFYLAVGTAAAVGGFIQESRAALSRYTRAASSESADRHRITAAIGETRVFTTLHEAIAAVRGGAPRAACRAPSGTRLNQNGLYWHR